MTNPRNCLKDRQTIGRAIRLGKRLRSSRRDGRPAPWQDHDDRLACAAAQQAACGGSLGDLRQPGGSVGPRRTVRRHAAQAVPASCRAPVAAPLPANLRRPSTDRRGARGDPSGRSRAVRRRGAGAGAARAGAWRRDAPGFGPPRPGEPGRRPARAGADPRRRARAARPVPWSTGCSTACGARRRAAGRAGHRYPEAGRGSRGRRHARPQPACIGRRRRRAFATPRSWTRIAPSPGRARPTTARSPKPPA